MTKWKDSLHRIKFEGSESVMKEITRLESEKLSLWDRLNLFMNREVEIPVAAAVSACLIVLMLGTSGINLKTDMAYTYSITVVNEWGQYETY